MLLITLVLLVVLSVLAYTLTTHLAARRHRAQYIIDYQSARYGCDSAVKYALATLEKISPRLISRPNEPDFSDLFRLSEEEYQEILAEWGAQKELERQQRAESGDLAALFEDEDDFFADMSGVATPERINGVNDVNNFNEPADFNDVMDFNDPNSLYIPGPYGPPWPLVARPVRFEIGSANVTVEVEDENAKYPLGWALLGNKEVQREAVAGFETFCAWMDVNEVDIESVKMELEGIKKLKSFKLNFKPITKRAPVRSKITSRRRTKGRPTRTAKPPQTTTTTVAQQIAKQAADVSKLLHSSMIDREMLARPSIISESREESALRYMGMWGSTRVNINTAPRQVLEAAFIFGGDADKIAQEIIDRRRTKPFKDIDDLKQALFRYGESIRKCEDYITTGSDFFTIRITSVSGVAEASAIIAITKQGGKVQRIGIISG